MPEENKPLADPAKNNAEVANTLNTQDATLKPTPPEELKHAGDALDAILKEKEAAAAADPPAVEPKPPGDATPPAKPEDATPPAAPVVPAEDPHKKKAEELFKDSPSLPQGASPKSAEAFAAVKIKAAQEISAREQRLADLEKKNKELEDRLKNPIPENVTKELEDLRQFRARLDIEADPKFKEFESSISKTREFIYAQLLTHPAIKEDTIEAIKKYGGPENVNFAKIFEAIKDPSLQRTIEHALTDIEKAKFSKAEAVKAAKANVSGYVSERQKEWENGRQLFAAETREHLTKYVGKLEWLKPKTVPNGADAAAKKEAEDYNEFVKTTNQMLEDSIVDDSADTRAVLLTGMAQLIYTQRVHEATVAERDALKAEVAKLTETIEKFKKGSTTRLREGAAPPGGGTIPANKPGDQLNVRPADALDAIAKKISDERAAKGV